MARLPRIVVPGQALHLIQRGNNRQPIFFCVDDYYKYLDTLKQSADESGCAIHAYVLMTNHIHLLVTPSTCEGVSQMMQGIGRRYVYYVNSVYQRSGTLWEGRFKSALIDSERYLLACSRYIELNPVRAKIVDGAGDYRWSSYRANALGHKDKLITPHALYKRLGGTNAERLRAYKSLFKTHVDAETLKLIRDNTEQCTIIGGGHFQEEIKLMLKRRVMKHQHGGDRKSDEFNNISSVLTP